MITVDTSVWIDFFAGRDTPQVGYLLQLLDDGDEALALTDIILTEILQGLRTDTDVRRVEERLAVFEVLRLRDLSDFRLAATMYRTARRQGVTIRRTSDCLIAAVCVRDQVPLLHADKDFDQLARVTELGVVEVPLAPGRG